MSITVKEETIRDWYNQLEEVREECDSWKALAEAQEQIIDEMMGNLLDLLNTAKKED